MDEKLTGLMDNRVEVYRHNSARIPSVTGRVIPEPVYTELQGWEADISDIREFNKLPEALKLFIEFIETQTGVPVTMVSVGPDREETIFRK
jgi:adenylosuccinate synthase